MTSDSPALTATIPRLFTTRLVLREPRMDDFDAYAANASDAQARAYVGGAIDRREAFRRFVGLSGYWVLQGTGWWIVEQRTPGRAVGMVGVYQRETQPEMRPEVEIGWAIYRAYWGQGLATEAARAALEFAVTIRRAGRVIAHVDRNNTPSIAVVTKLAMQCEGEVDFYGERTLRFAR